MNEVRAGLGLAPLVGNAVAASVVADVARGDLEDEPASLSYVLGCVACETLRGEDARVVYRRRGGRGVLAFGLWRRRWSVRRNLRVHLTSAASLLDPRARTLSAAPTPRAMEIVAVALRPGARFARPVRWPAGEVDPRRRLWFGLLLPPGSRGPVCLVERRGEGAVTVARPAVDVHVVGGARLLGFGFPATLAFARSYEVRVGLRALEVVQTRALPERFRRRSWRFVAVRSEDRAAFLEIVRRGPPPLRRLLGEVDGAVTVVGGDGGCTSADSCERTDGARAVIGFRWVHPFKLLHELGHVVFDLALDEPGRIAFERAFATSRRWDGRCLRRRLCPLAEIFADQLAFWALGRRAPRAGSYAEPALLPAERFSALLTEHGAYRPRAPLPARGA